ncbi:hypothetical protein ACQP1G_20845 [Nocardia sp. CA-107356]|uniref:hypothetical protein n=1 Tax=Nocardia sp. CA-107356 TaxID=3239972 RepID=UPI003D94A5BA
MPIITVPDPGGNHHGKRWVKTLTGVDQSKTNGFAFEGTFVNIESLAEVAEGSYLLGYAEDCTSRARVRWVDVTVWQVRDGELDEINGWRLSEPTSKTWALAVRDEVAAILDASGSADPEEGGAAVGPASAANKSAPTAGEPDSAAPQRSVLREGVYIDPTARVEHPGMIGFTTVIGADAQITGFTRIWGAASGLPTRIGPGAVIIGGLSRLDETVVGEHVQVGAGTRIEAGAAISTGALIGAGAHIGPRAHVIANVIIPPGLVVPERAEVIGDPQSAARGREKREKFTGTPDPLLVAVADLLEEPAALPNSVTSACDGAYRRERGSWRYAITNLKGRPVPGARDVTLGDLTGDVFTVNGRTDVVAVPLVPTLAHRAWFEWANRYAIKHTHMDQHGHRTDCRLIDTEVWQQAAAMVVDIIAPELSPAALLTTEQAAAHAETTSDALMQTTRRSPDQIRPVAGSPRGYLWSAPLIAAYAVGKRPKGHHASRF